MEPSAVENNEELVAKWMHMQKQKTPRTRSKSKTHAYKLQIEYVQLKIEFNMNQSMRNVMDSSKEKITDSSKEFYQSVIDDTRRKMLAHRKVMHIEYQRLLECDYNQDEKNEALKALETVDVLLDLAKPTTTTTTLQVNALPVTDVEHQRITKIKEQDE